MGQEQHTTTGVHNGVAKFESDKPNPALFTNEKREIFMGTSPELTPGTTDCVVRMRCNGICGSERSRYESEVMKTDFVQL